MRAPVSPHPNPPPLAGEGVGLGRPRGSDPPPQTGEGGAPRSGDRVGACLTMGSALDETAGALAAGGLDEPRRRARRLVAAALDLSEAEVFAHPEHILSAEEHDRIGAITRRVAAREPLSRVLGRREFWGLDFTLSPDTLDPRPDSETVVEAVLARLPDRAKPYRFLDFGTGTGCLLLALLSEYPAASGVGIDIAFGAVQTARHNAERF